MGAKQRMLRRRRAAPKPFGRAPKGGLAGADSLPWRTK